MRTLKFRAWDKTRTANCSYDTFTLQELLQGRCRNPQDYENWEESTGLLDKNGKEIYEGDIDGKSVIKFGSFDGDSDENMENICGFYEENIRTGNRRVLTPSSAKTWFEIIGNIYSNPEFLQDTNSTESV